MTTTALETLPGSALAEGCDRCSARALVSTTFRVGEQIRGLYWCGHHFAAHERMIRDSTTFLRVTVIGSAN